MEEEDDDDDDGDEEEETRMSMAVRVSMVETKSSKIVGFLCACMYD